MTNPNGAQHEVLLALIYAGHRFILGAAYILSPGSRTREGWRGEEANAGWSGSNKTSIDP